MPEIQQQLALVTAHHELRKQPKKWPGGIMREWSIEIFQVTDGINVAANAFEKVTYHLHESFPRTKQVQVFKKPPFRIRQSGWGEFQIRIELTSKYGGGVHEIFHDLSFALGDAYSTTATVTFVDPSSTLAALLGPSDSLPTPEATTGLSGLLSPPGSLDQHDAKVDLLKLAEALTELCDDDIYEVAKMAQSEGIGSEQQQQGVIEDTMMFDFDLNVQSETFIKTLWDFVGSKVHITDGVPDVDSFMQEASSSDTPDMEE
ncbi:hypothetical protein K504DRAFT_510546 [Pleomassaria siparia CBS 279.74]|uniref:Protein AF-9 homolog n=1 Tax=Pleomassaria siparia CBS 279.74 TaxID=1314801 RepID=A0A6G1KR76_9PLEO|nr:hypothetical protein K504DRAFT_510546 [Pleomassaria siparia CBS 279.74]